MKEGVILLGHGSRREEANNEIHELGRKAAEYFNGLSYQVAFLSFGSPNLETAVKKFVDEGIERILIMPVFLATGNHIKKDIPAKIDQEKEKYPGIDFVTVGHFGPDPILAKLIYERINEARE